MYVKNVLETTPPQPKGSQKMMCVGSSMGWEGPSGPAAPYSRTSLSGAPDVLLSFLMSSPKSWINAD